MVRRGVRITGGVVFCDISHKEGAITKAEFDEKYGPSQSTFVTCDVTSPAQLKDLFSQTVQKYGKLDILCNNAGINDENIWEKTISVNLVALIQANYLALEHMRCDRGGQGGSIVNVASMSSFHPAPHAPVYTATKHGVLGFTRSLADASRFGNFGIRINALCPGFVNTRILETLDQEEILGMFYQFKDMTKDWIRSFGILEPSDVAAAFIQLVEDHSLNGAAMKITSSKGIQFENF
ncbi:15-hydroxyprostaglandin dehydrogenase [NAD(+)]-like isoform X2 [Rhinoraja longicauda]